MNKPNLLRQCLTLLPTLLALTIVTGCDPSVEDSASPAATDPLAQLVVDTTRITVSGISAGGYMASQLHLALSDTVSGVGIVAAGPWWCSRGDITRALNLCTKGGDFELPLSIAKAKELAQQGQIDPLSNLRDDPVYLFRGSADATIAATVADGAEGFYQQLANPDLHLSERSIPAAHAMVTVDQGAACGDFVAPFINACNYDTAGEMLKHLTQRSATATEARGTMVSVAVPGAQGANMLPQASLYLPQQCSQGNICGIHVALHGCQQSTQVVGDAFIETAGYNRWADALDLMVLYPQVASSSFAPMNPLGCWDWWGYSGPDYVSRSAPQIAAIKDLLDSLAR